MPVATNAAWTNLTNVATDRAMQPLGGDVYLQSGASPIETDAIKVLNEQQVVLPGGTQYHVRAIHQAAVNVSLIDYGA